MRVLYVQYTNPGAYPPLVRGAQLLAEAGASVLMLGTRIAGLDALDVKPSEAIDVRLLPPATDGWRLKAHYARYVAWVAREGAAWRPDWIYASDVLAAPVALALASITRARLVYHEHDAPSPEHASWAIKRCLAARRRVVRRADLVLTPNAERSAALSRTVGGGRPVLTVWNCPRRPARDTSERRPSDTLRVVFRGSINPDRLPMSVIHALARVHGDVTLDVASYETAGSRGYVAELQSLAQRLGIDSRVRSLGTVPERELAAVCEASDIGLALMPAESRDENMRHMTGASNKVFEYLVYGVVPLVSGLADWRAEFVDPGVALACDPRDAESIATALAWAATHRGELCAIAARGRQRLLADWNYETQFAPVLRALSGSGETEPSGTLHAEARCAS